MTALSRSSWLLFALASVGSGLGCGGPADSGAPAAKGGAPRCGDLPSANAGATDGPLTLAGHLRDAHGTPIVGGRIDLDGSAHAVRFSDLSGGYSFHVAAGSYSLKAASECSFAQPTADLGNVTANASQDFTAAGVDCVAATQSNVIATGSVFAVTRGGATLGMTYVHVEERSSAGDALALLEEIAAEQPQTPSCALTIAGDAATERQVVVSLAGPQGGPSQPFVTLTTAIAIGSTVVRFESQLNDSSAATTDRFRAAARAFTAEELPELRGPSPSR